MLQAGVLKTVGMYFQQEKHLNCSNFSLVVKEVDIGSGSKADFQLIQEICSATLNVYLSTNTEHGKEAG